MLFIYLTATDLSSSSQIHCSDVDPLNEMIGGGLVSAPGPTAKLL